MIPIVKGHEPAALTEVKRDIRNTPDATFDYTALRGEPKQRVLEALVAEQGHLCAYCMCRIGVDKHPATIEHLIPQHPSYSVEIASWVLTTITWLPSVMGETGQHATNGVAMLL